ncbi:MAG: hypothetical protein MUO51_08915 [Woeseiaceae bacterium]|nr:hypothetical protein [Woeseiaceae bacterium]
MNYEIRVARPDDSEIIASFNSRMAEETDTLGMVSPNYPVMESIFGDAKC